MESAAEGHHFGGALLDATYGSKRRVDVIKEISGQQRVAVTSVNVWLICNPPSGPGGLSGANAGFKD
jgi:hypothetical protein